MIKCASPACRAVNGILQIVAVIFLFCSFSSVSAAQSRNCTVALGPHPNRYLPLIASRTRGLLQPVGGRSIFIQKGETVRIACPGKDNRIVGQNVEMLNVTCNNRGQLVLPHSNNFTINCTQRLEKSINETNIICGSNTNSRKIYIGWRLPNGEFFRQIEVCFNYLNLTTEYTVHDIRGDAVAYRDRDVSWQGRTSFKHDKFFSSMSPSITTSYTQDNQKETLERLLGSMDRANYYIGGWGPNSYLAKGHLSPDADFTLQTWQDATYHFINVAPQWQESNNGNWKVLENAIRIMASKQPPRNLTIYTGTYGVVKLKDTNERDVSFYLAEGNKKQVPVPKYMWKIVSNPKRNESVAFVLLNTPGAPPTYSGPPICNDVCDQIHWVTWTARDDPLNGIMYCCSVSELKGKFRNIPDIHGLRLMES